MNPDKIFLGVALPDTNATFLKEFVDSFFCIIRPSRSVYIRPHVGGPIHHIRNHLVEQAQNLRCTHLMFMDTDQTYPQNAIVKLLEHEKKCVAAKVHRRYPPYDPILLRGKLHDYENIPEDEWENGGLIKVDATGFGCVLLDMQVFNDIEKPYFDFVLTGEKPVGEDIYFWSKVRQAGISVYVDCDIKIGHLGVMNITEESYHAYKYTSAWDRGDKP
jgi:hypothetical protein